MGASEVMSGKGLGEQRTGASCVEGTVPPTGSQLLKNTAACKASPHRPRAGTGAHIYVTTQDRNRSWDVGLSAAAVRWTHLMMEPLSLQVCCSAVLRFCGGGYSLSLSCRVLLVS